MHAFSVAPFDQNLSIDGKVLSDDCATLGTLGVIPESVILLKVSSGFAPAGFRGFSRVDWVRRWLRFPGPRQDVATSYCCESTASLDEPPET